MSVRRGLSLPSACDLNLRPRQPRSATDIVAAEIPARLVTAGIDPMPAAAVPVKTHRVPARAGREAPAAVGEDLLLVAAAHALPAEQV